MLTITLFALIDETHPNKEGDKVEKHTICVDEGLVNALREVN